MTDGFACIDSSNFWTPHVRFITHRRGLKTYYADFVHDLVNTVGKSHICVSYFVFLITGVRHLHRHALHIEELPIVQQEVFRQLQAMKNETVVQYLHQSKHIKRLLKHFMVHYVACHTVAYYLDKTTCPYSVMGAMSCPHQPEILDQMNKGKHIVWINLHHEYKLFKRKIGTSVGPSPYSSTLLVQEKEGVTYSLNELSFYVWFDSVRGMVAFNMFKDRLREHAPHTVGKCFTTKRGLTPYSTSNSNSIELK
jgi:hypothetical protein